MTTTSEITIRPAKIDDLAQLREFFIKAYGTQTIFQNADFLLYFFDAHNGTSPFSFSLIAVNSANQIVSHYGGLRYKLQLKDSLVPIVWGVNAYTLPEFRGHGINSKIVAYIQRHNEVNAVIGMPLDAPHFYEKCGYSIFEKKTLNRFVYVLDSQTLEIVTLIGQESTEAIQKLQPKPQKSSDAENIILLNKENYKDHIFNLRANISATTYRDANFLSWRLFKNPFINYTVFGYVENNVIVTYAATRTEVLEPTNQKVTRIIDLFGKTTGIRPLLDHVIAKATAEESLYVDFSMFGKLYETELIACGFEKLEADSVTWLPMVCSPIEKRPNHEFVVLYSANHADIQKLAADDVYFTRIDGDRDRIARISQLQ